MYVPEFRGFGTLVCIQLQVLWSGEGPEGLPSLVQSPSLAPCVLVTSWAARLFRKPNTTSHCSAMNPTPQRELNNTGSNGPHRWPQCHAPAASVSLDVLGQVIAAHEAPIAQLAAEALLARVSAAMARQLVGARESPAASRPLAAERPLARVRADVGLQVGALEVRLAAARVVAHVRAPALFGHRGGVDEQRGLNGPGNEELHGPDRNERRLDEGFVGAHHGENRRGGRLWRDGHHGPCRLLTYHSGRCHRRRWAGARRSSDDH